MSKIELPIEKHTRIGGSRWPSYEGSKDLPVFVVTMRGSHYFDDLDSAKRKFPSLDPWKNGKKFTWAMKGRQRGRQVMRFEDWEVNRSMSMSASDKTAAGMAQIRKQVRIKAQVKVDTSKQQTLQWYTFFISGRLWLDLGEADIAPFRFKAQVEDYGEGELYVGEFRPVSGALAGGAKDLATFYEGALTEILKSKPSLLKG